ncbi:hydrogenase formation protein HypD [Caloramator sp. E03]|uniref:hydrogenase formation protein HypD n=1 Tax=Caloramator sp. E03 TaxID=2576307 RepID=UPI0011107B62|nr:hydrogenase formation protein HypD [Caloramator sp. E03]QCX32609.1 hydrogenase formation protein HypD [Caloramator sp. E03]
MLWEEFNKSDAVENIIRILKEYKKRITIMEVCGTHTMAIAKFGIKSILPKNIRLISGPGCPVCVTPVEIIDEIIKLSKIKDVIITTYGDMIKVPGSNSDESLERRKAEGADIRVVYSPMDALEIAKKNSDKEIVFIGIGFETTAPNSAVAVETAINEEIKNFSLFSIHKRVEPVLRHIINMDNFEVNGFLCPGNVAVIIGEEGFEFLVKEYKIPSVICGFEAGDIIYSIYRLSEMIKNNTPFLENEYIRAVKKKGNEKAKAAIDNYFEFCDDLWRGIGFIKNSGYKLKNEYSDFDATKKFSIELKTCDYTGLCRCGDVIKGKIEPFECEFFSRICTPENPLGPCMVSSEGACASEYKYSRMR